MAHGTSPGRLKLKWGLERVSKLTNRLLLDGGREAGQRRTHFANILIAQDNKANSSNPATSRH